MLPDLLRSKLNVVFCGTAAGNRSARLQEYYAGKGNKFWKTLFVVHLTDRQLLPSQYKQLFNYDIGLTDLVKTKAGMDSKLVHKDFGNKALEEKIIKYKPKILCFNGKRGAEEFLLRDVVYGYQDETIDETKIFVAPSTSSAASGFWDISYWKELSSYIIGKKEETNAFGH